MVDPYDLRDNGSKLKFNDCKNAYTQWKREKECMRERDKKRDKEEIKSVEDHH